MKKDSSRKITITNQTEGLERRQELLGGITQGGTYLPKPIDYSDIDRATVDFIEGDIELSIDGEKVPVYFLSIQKWTEFTKTWGKSDEFKDLKMPFITIVRDPDIQPGNNQDGLFDVAGFPTFFYHKVPTFNNGREGFDIYKIPQPTSSDLTYHVRFFTNRMQELNKIQNKIQRTFKSRQFYVNVLGHPMPIILENVGDASKIDDIESRRYYGLDFEMVVNGYILNEDDFEVTPMVDRALLLIEGNSVPTIKPKIKKSIKKLENVTKINFDILFKYKSENFATIKLDEPITFNMVSGEHNLSTYDILVNGEAKPELPFSVVRGDVMKINISRVGDSISSITLTGDLD